MSVRMVCMASNRLYVRLFATKEEQVFAALCASKVKRAWLGRVALRVEFDQEDDKVTRHDRVNRALPSQIIRFLRYNIRVLRPFTP